MILSDDFNSILNDFIDVDFDCNTKSHAEEILNVLKKYSMQMEEFKPKVYIVVEFAFNKNSIKKFYCKKKNSFMILLMKCYQKKKKVQMKFFL